jgi:hypothetical protein
MTRAGLTSSRLPEAFQRAPADLAHVAASAHPEHREPGGSFSFWKNPESHFDPSSSYDLIASLQTG